jgi:hypothetical protein
MSKEMFIAAYDELMDEYAEEHGVDPAKIPDAAERKIADRAMTRMSDRIADMIDHYRERAKYGEV